MLRLLQQYLNHLQVAAVVQCPGIGVPRWPACTTTIRMATTRRHKKNSDLRGYDHLLHQWKCSQAHSGKGKPPASKKHKQASTKQWFEAAPFDGSTSNGSTGRTSKSAGRRKHRSPEVFHWQGSSHTWSNADLAEAAAAAQLHPDEYYNLVFGKPDHTDGSREAKRGRRKARRLRRRARRMQQAAKAWGYAEYSYDWSDSEDDSDDEWQQQQHYHVAGRPDWQWWDDQQERQWFEQAWRQSNGRQGRQQQQSQQDRNSSSSYGSYSSRPWWESFHQSFKQQQEQYSQQQQHNHTHHSSQHHQQHHSSSWQQAGTTVRHPPSVLEHLAVLGLPPNAALQRGQLKVAFHKAAMQWHPDMHVGDGPKAAAEAKFKQVKEAYESLIPHAPA